MGDLLSILSSAATSLAAQSALTATAGHNIDNANTPGYARQIANLETVTPAEQVNGAYIGRGATLASVTQARDRFLEAQIPQALGNAAYQTAQSDALQAFHGLDPGATGGLDSAISGFYSSLTALAQNPGDAATRTAFLGAATALAQAFNRTSQSIASSRSGLDAQASGLTTQINNEAAAVAQLNVQIRQASAGGATPNDLLDLRQQHLDALAQLTGATFVTDSQGNVNVTLQGGLALVAGDRAGSLSTTPDPSNGGHLAVTFKQADGSGTVTLSSAALGGSLGGTLSARDGALANVATQVDRLAYDVAGAVNAQHAAGYGLDGSTDLALFDVGVGAGGAAGRMSVTITDPRQIATAAAAGAPGDATNANAILATQSAALSGGQDVQATLSGVVSQFGSAAASAKAFADQDGAIQTQLTTMRQSYSGVSIDEEMIAMQQAQRGYEAIAKVIQVTDEMLQTLIAMKTTT